MRPMVLLFLALFNSILGLSVLFPILAPLGRELGLSELQVGSLSTGYALMQFLVSAYWGRKSDEKGRKPVLLTGILGFALSFFAFAGVAHLGMLGMLSHWPLYIGLLATRLIGGTLSSATIPTAQAYAADISERGDRTKAMAVIGAAFGSGVIFGPGIGAGLSILTGNLLAPVYFSASVAVLNAIFVAVMLPEPERHASRGEGARQGLGKVVWPLLAVGLCATLASVAMEQTVAFTFQDRLGLDELGTAKTVGIALMAYGVVAVVAQGFIVRRFGFLPIVLLRSGLPIALGGFVLFIFASNFAELTGALLLQGFGQGLVLPGVTAGLSLAVSDQDQGAVAGLNSASQGLGRTLGPVVGTGLYQIRNDLPYVFSASLLAIVLLVVLARPGLAAAHPAPAPEPAD